VKKCGKKHFKEQALIPQEIALTNISKLFQRAESNNFGKAQYFSGFVQLKREITVKFGYSDEVRRGNIRSSHDTDALDNRISPRSGSSPI